MSGGSMDRRRGGGEGGRRKNMSPADSALVKFNSWLGHIPLLTPNMMQPAEGGGPDLATMTAQIAQSWSSDFCWSSSFDAKFIAALMYEGYLPTAHGPVHGPQEYVLLPKLHQQRCIMQFEDLRIRKGVRSKAAGLMISIDTAFEQVIVKCLEQHGESWLHPPVVQGFRELFEQGGCGHVRVHSIEVWKDGVLVAGELGYSVGAMYTSLSGFTCLDSSGTVQIVSLGLILHEHGFDCWDLGMGMDYKQSMGAKNVHRLRFLEKLRAVRERSVKELGMAATPARDILAPKLPIGRLVHLDVSKATGPGVQGRQPGGSDPSASAGEVIGMVVGVRGVELKIRLEPGDKGLAFARLQALRELGGKGDAGGTGMSGELPRSLSGLGAGGGRKGRAKRRKKMTPRVAGAAQEHGDGDGATLRGGGGGSAALESGAMDVDAGGIPTADQLAHHRAWERACALRVAARGYLARALRERQSAGGLSKRATRRLRKLMSREGKLTLRKLGTA